MNIRRRVSGIAAGVALAGTLFTPLAGADTQTESHPETPTTNPDLPIVHTSHGSDHIKANILNPHPVCNSAEDFRTVVYKATDTFAPAGTISTTNQTDKSIKLQQDLSKSQEISVSISGDRTETTGFNLGGEGSKSGLTGSAGISHEIAKKISGSASYSLSWEAGQSIGPYDVPPNHTGEATYGFRVLNMTGTQQYCKPNGTWSTPTFWSALQPIKNEVRVKNYDKLSDSYAPNKNAQTTTDAKNPQVGQEDRDPEKDAEELNSTESNEGDAPKDKVGDEIEGVEDQDLDSDGNSKDNSDVKESEDEGDKESDSKESDKKETEATADDETQKIGEDEDSDSEDSDKVETNQDENAEENQGPDVDSEPADTDEISDAKDRDSESAEDLDLKPYLQTSGIKAEGFAGTVALNVENVGKKRYYGEYPATQFRVDVKTDEGPEKVDRLITPRSSNGAHIRDLGYDYDKGVRSFEVTLSNPVNPGDKARVANLDFGDGLTKEGRIKNYIEVTQTSRLDGDKSKDNDQNVDSHDKTVTDFGKKHSGLF